MSHQEFAAGLLDLVKAFETVPHFILAALAHECGYPLVILRFCLAAYSLQRSVGVDGVYSKLVVATRGITVGAGMATTELTLLLPPMMNKLQERWACKLVAKLYVDDLTIEALGPEEAVLGDALKDFFVISVQLFWTTF